MCVFSRRAEGKMIIFTFLGASHGCSSSIVAANETIFSILQMYMDYIALFSGFRIGRNF
jgi:Fe-S cluster biogenesis protein NfuA